MTLQVKFAPKQSQRAIQCSAWQNICLRILKLLKRCQTNSSKIRTLLKQSLTDKINDRETFMKGIDYSYYYEQNDDLEK